MNKQEIQQRVLQFGKPLDLDKFEWDENTNTFSSSENNLVLDFKGINACTFDTSYNCTFNTGSDCTFNTGSDCTFNTGSECVVVRRDVYEVIELEEGKEIKLNSWGIKGYIEKKEDWETSKEEFMSKYPNSNSTPSKTNEWEDRLEVKNIKEAIKNWAEKGCDRFEPKECDICSGLEEIIDYNIGKLLKQREEEIIEMCKDEQKLQIAMLSQDGYDSLQKIINKLKQ